MTLKSSIDGILTRVTSGAQKDRVPGVVAMITVRKGNIYEGAAGETVLGSGNAMKLDSVHAIFTARMLMLHTAGFGYDFFNEKYNAMAQKHGQPSVVSASRASINTPLLFDPGEKWEYGSSIDWCGQVVEGIRGKRLGEVFKERIFNQLEIEDMAFTMTPSMQKRQSLRCLAALCQRLQFSPL